MFNTLIHPLIDLWVRNNAVNVVTSKEKLTFVIPFGCIEKFTKILEKGYRGVFSEGDFILKSELSPEKIKIDLSELIPFEYWLHFSNENKKEIWKQLNHAEDILDTLRQFCINKDLELDILFNNSEKLEKKVKEFSKSLVFVARMSTPILTGGYQIYDKYQYKDIFIFHKYTKDYCVTTYKHMIYTTIDNSSRFTIFTY